MSVELAALLPLAIRASIVLTVFGLGLGADPSDASYLFRRPARLARSLLSMNVAMPLVATALALAFALYPAVKIALVTLAVSPVPPILPRKQLKAGGHASYTIGLLVAAALLAIVFVPLALALLERAFGLSKPVPSATVARLVTLTVLGPLAAGLLVRRLVPSVAQRAAGPISTAAMVILVAAILPILLVSGPAIRSLIGNGTLAALAAFWAVGLVTGHLLGGPSPAERLVLALATATRHPGVSVAVASAMFPDQKLAAPAIGLYLVVASIGSALYLGWFRRRQRAGAGQAEPATTRRSAA